MLILAVDTALAGCSAALWRAGESVCAVREPMARGQAERLVPMVQELLAEAQVAPLSLDRIAVTTGPGSFTGLRVGLSFARAFGLAVAKPVIGLSTLEALAAGAASARVVAAVTMAGSVFVGAWEGRRCVAQPQRVLDVAAFLDGLGPDWSLTGPGAATLARLRPDWPLIPQELVDPHVLAGLAASADPKSHPPAPLYLRGSDARLPGGRLADDDREGLA